MEIKKVIILENDSEQDADNDDERDIAQASFPGVPVEIWYRFYFGFTKHDDYCNWDRLAKTDVASTLFLTRTQLANGPVSGYGDLIKMWLNVFQEIHNRGYSLKICVLTYPSFHWQLIKWVQEGTGGSEATKRRGTLVRKVLDYHTLFTMGYSETEFYNALRVDKKWLRLNMFPHYAPFEMNGKKHQLGYLQVNHEGVGYTYSYENESGGWSRSTADKPLTIEEVRNLFKKSKKVKNG